MKAKMKLSATWIASYVYEIRGGNPNATQLLGLGWPSVNFGATLSSSEQEDKRLFLLQSPSEVHQSREREGPFEDRSPQHFHQPRLEWCLFQNQNNKDFRYSE